MLAAWLCQWWEFIQAQFLKFFLTPVCVAPPLSPMGQQGAGAAVQFECRIYLLPQENVTGTGGTGFPNSWHPAPRSCWWGGLGAALGDGGGR